MRCGPIIIYSYLLQISLDRYEVVLDVVLNSCMDADD
jgi:hypothetical protein